MRRFVPLLLAAMLLSACRTQENYLLNRGGDLADVIRIAGMAGKGVGVKLEGTQLVHVGAGIYDEVRAAGVANREVTDWTMSGWDWGVLVGYHHEETTGIPYYSGSYGWDFYGAGPGTFVAADPENSLDLLTLRGTLMLGLGLDLQLRVGELLDFLAGIFQFDPARDDYDYVALRESGEEG